MKALSELQKEIHAVAVDKGWWDGGERNLGEQFSNFHAELSEAWEEIRNGRDVKEIYYKDGKPEGVPIELADCIIRILDTCGAYDIDIEEAIRIKVGFNKTRPYRHGNKTA